MSNDKLNSVDTRLLDSFREALKRSWRAMGSSSENDANRDVWRAAYQVFAEVCEKSVGSESVQLPKEVVRFARDALNDIARSQLEKSQYAFKQRRGRPSSSFSYPAYVKSAFVYIEMAKLNLIDDSSPVISVLESYGIKRDTYHDWRSRYKTALKEAKSFSRRLAALKVDGTSNEDHEWSAERVRLDMLQSGLIYQDFIAS
jgi:hypothetical protein